LIQLAKYTRSSQSPATTNMKTTVLNVFAIVLIWATAVFALAAVDDDRQPLVALGMFPITARVNTSS
jgi:hypothetical protein